MDFVRRKRMIETIISNNCAGAAIMHDLGMEFKTPTINLQILPEDFPRFCINLKEYMKYDLIECHDFTLHEQNKLIKMLGGTPQIPFGLVGDVLVCFQHYETFAEAKAKWDERRARIDYDHIGYLFHVRGPEYQFEAEEFLAANLPNKLCITEGFEIPESIGLYPKEGDNAFSLVNGKLLITQVADFRSWRELG